MEKKEEMNMNGTRTMAFQIPEELLMHDNHQRAFLQIPDIIYFQTVQSVPLCVRTVS